MSTAFSSRNAFAVQFQNRLTEITNATMRNRVLLMMMMSRNRIKPAEGGEFLEWNVYMRNPKPRGYSGEGVPEYNDPDSLVTARLGWASYHYGLRLGRHKLQTNFGKTQFVNLLTKSLQEVEDSFVNRWPELFYQDIDNPDATNDPKPMAGFYSWFAKYIDSAAAADQGYQGKVRLCSGSYADIVMDLGTESSDWKGDDGFSTVQTTDADLGVTAGESWWPYGRGDSAFDYFHPLVVNTSTSKWGTGAGFNVTYCTKQLDFGIQFSRRTAKGDKGQINLILTGTQSMLTIKERFENTYRTLPEIIPNDPMGGPGANTGSGLAYGQPIYQYSGCYLVDDFDMPNSHDLIGLNLDRISYQPCFPYQNAGPSRIPIMEPYEGEYPGGGGRMLGGFTLGQLMTDTPRGTCLWSPLGD